MNGREGRDLELVLQGGAPPSPAPSPPRMVIGDALTAIQERYRELSIITPVPIAPVPAPTKQNILGQLTELHKSYTAVAVGIVVPVPVPIKQNILGQLTELHKSYTAMAVGVVASVAVTPPSAGSAAATVSKQPKVFVDIPGFKKFDNSPSTWDLRDASGSPGYISSDLPILDTFGIVRLIGIKQTPKIMPGFDAKSICAFLHEVVSHAQSTNAGNELSIDSTPIFKKYLQGIATEAVIRAKAFAAAAAAPIQPDVDPVDLCNKNLNLLKEIKLIGIDVSDTDIVCDAAVPLQQPVISSIIDVVGIPPTIGMPSTGFTTVGIPPTTGMPITGFTTFGPGSGPSFTVLPPLPSIPDPGVLPPGTLELLHILRSFYEPHVSVIGNAKAEQFLLDVSGIRAALNYSTTQVELLALKNAVEFAALETKIKTAVLTPIQKRFDKLNVKIGDVIKNMSKLTPPLTGLTTSPAKLNEYLEILLAEAAVALFGRNAIGASLQNLAKSYSSLKSAAVVAPPGAAVPAAAPAVALKPGAPVPGAAAPAVALKPGAPALAVALKPGAAPPAAPAVALKPGAASPGVKAPPVAPAAALKPGVPRAIPGGGTRKKILPPFIQTRKLKRTLAHTSSA
jgi:hypothetical protein